MQVTGLAVADITAYARSLVNEAPEDVAEQVREASSAVVETYSGVAAEGAALFYEQQSPQQSPRVEIAPPSIGEELMSDLGFALLPMFTPDAFASPVSALLERVGGVVQRHVAAGDRQTLMLTANADPLSKGVRRFARPASCGFCAYLSSMEATVYADTDWHRNCHCVNVPYWEDNPLPNAEHMDRFEEAAGKAREAILADYREKRKLAPDLRMRNFYKKFPETAVNTKNIAARMRADLGLAH